MSIWFRRRDARGVHWYSTSGLDITVPVVLVLLLAAALFLAFGMLTTLAWFIRVLFGHLD